MSTTAVGFDGTDRVVWVDGVEAERRPATADELAALTSPPDSRAELLARLDDAVLLDEIRAVVADAINGGVI